MDSISERFSRFMEYGEEIDMQLCRLEELEASVGNNGAGAFDRYGRAAGSHSDRTGRLAAAITDLETKIREMTAKEAAERNALDSVLCTQKDGMYLLKASERGVIRARCFDRLSWERTADIVKLSVRGAQIAQERAFKKLDAHFDEA